MNRVFNMVIDQIENTILIQAIIKVQNKLFTVKIKKNLRKVHVGAVLHQLAKLSKEYYNYYKICYTSSFDITDHPLRSTDEPALDYKAP